MSTVHIATISDDLMCNQEKALKADYNYNLENKLNNFRRCRSAVLWFVCLWIAILSPNLFAQSDESSTAGTPDAVSAAPTVDPTGVNSTSTEAERMVSPLERPEREKEAIAALAVLPVQSGGRVKPIDTLARETLQMLHGREKVEGRHPVEIFFSMLFHPKFWEDYKLVPVNYKPLKRDLGLEAETKYFSLKELRSNTKILPLIQEVQNKQTNGEKLDPYFQAVSQIRNQVSLFSFLVSGQMLALFPPSPEADSSKWAALDQVSEEQKLSFWLLAAAFQNKDPIYQLKTSEKVEQLMNMARAINPAIYPSLKSMQREVHFNNLHPFRWAWIFALVSLIVLLFALVRDVGAVTSFKEKLPNSRFYIAGLSLYGISFCIQVYGYFLRVMIAERPPVTNMYESVIWVAFGTMLFGFIIEMISRKRVVAICSLIFAIMCLMIADLSSAVFDDSIHPLEPVLRSNFWLLIHVLTITISYAAFALSLVLGNLALAPFVFLGRPSKLFPLKEMANYAYRAVQIGVVLLGAGTILGGVWADYSWGRFWGWDPKETWALIAFLGYVAIIHARFRGMVRDFGFLAWCIVAFLLVLMAWYGVNFILGAGLHSYGFSSGGNTEVFVYTILQCVFVAYATWAKKRSL